MAEYYDRYAEFRLNGTVQPIPGIFIPLNSTDKRVVYKNGETRLDKLSQKYYNNPYHGFLIMAANAQYGGLEFDIKDQDIIIIPFPWKTAVERYINEINEHKRLYG
tara:strand:- start:353 stop:670 length:318 start_codon:yes stop_codon:yes gene_type:complete